MSPVPAPNRPQPEPEPAPTEFEQAFDAMVRAHYGRLYRFVYRFVGSREASEDIVQDLFASIWQRAVSFNYGDPLPYLYQAARNRALSFLRTRRVRERWHAAQADGEAAAVPAAAAGTDPTELGLAIEQAIESLPERCRLIFRMHREQHLSYSEIARLLGLSVKTVDNQMGRALKALRERLAPYLPASVVLLALAGRSLRLL